MSLLSRTRRVCRRYWFCVKVRSHKHCTLRALHGYRRWRCCGTDPLGLVRYIRHCRPLHLVLAPAVIIRPVWFSVTMVRVVSAFSVAVRPKWSDEVCSHASSLWSTARIVAWTYSVYDLHGSSGCYRCAARFLSSPVCRRYTGLWLLQTLCSSRFRASCQPVLTMSLHG